jgi:hypothetical protein
MSAALVLSGLGPVSVVQAQACGGNAIACENQLPGNPSSEWDISGTGDPSIQGYATDISYNKGTPATFKVNTSATAYRLDIYRLGYYQGNGARKVATVNPSATLPQNQPACLTDAPTGLIDCGNWAVSASWAIPATAVSGIYVARLVRPDTGGASHIVFIVRDDSSHSALLFQASDTTWQAYNNYGGNSLYVGTAPSADGRAYKVSYNRPFATRTAQSGKGDMSWVFGEEYPTIRWLEANGFDVTYSTATDTDRRGLLIQQHKTLLSVGHDEYWSAGQRANVEAARGAGVNLAFFSGNEIFWKTRWEPSIDPGHTANRTLVSYKETHANARIDPADPPTATATWRDPRFGSPSDGGRPENALSGTIFMVNCCVFNSITVPAADGKMRLWRNTSVASLPPGDVATLGDAVLGHEFDEDIDNGFRPAGAFQASTTTVNNVNVLQDYGSTYAVGTGTHHVMMYRHASGALVFAAGTIQWAWGLDGNHDHQSTVPDVSMQQATLNVLADMGAQATTLQPGLVAATASTDTTPPTSTISSPTAGAQILQALPLTITGTAADAGGGVVGGVEVSVDGGTSWHPATGRESWSYTYTPTTTGQTTIRSRAVDDSGNLETPSAGVTITVKPNSPPAVSAVSISSVNSSAATVNWTTDRATDSQVDYGTTTAYGSSTPLQASLVTNHSVQLGGLQAGTVYHFRIRSGDSQGQMITSDYTLMTAPAGNQVFAGDVSIESNVDAVAAGSAEAFQVTAASSGTVSSMFVYLDAANAATSVGLGLYAHNATTNSPSTLLAQGTLTSATAGAWNSISISNTTLTAGTKYWIALLAPAGGGQAVFRDVLNGGPAQASSQVNLAALPAGWSAGANYANSPLSAYLVGPVTGPPPTVSLSAPANGATVSGSAVTVSATASSASGIANVQFLLDGAPLGVPVTTSPYTLTWNTTSVGNGTHSLSARATDTVGLTNTSAAVSVTVSNPPTISQIVVSGIAPTGATIGWTTNVPATSQVMYGVTAAYGSQTPLDTTLVTSHSQTVSGLQGGTTYHFQVQSKDSTNALISSADQTFTTAPPVTCPCSLWSASATPATASAADGNAYELGVRFKSDTNGYISGIRFYKGTNNTGTHVGNLWTNTGTLLASATFSGESATGWQQVTFGTPVAITANTLYVASYRAPNGGYAVNANYFTSSGVDNGALHAPSSVQAGGNGVFANGATSVFPSQSFNDSNYWVDVLYSPTLPPQITGVGASGISSTAATIGWTTSAPANSQVFYGTTTAYGSQTTLDTALVTSHSQALSGLQAGTTYHYQVKSKDNANVLVSSPDQTFTTAPTSCPCSLWSSSTTPATASAADGNAYELGVRFKSDTNGYISGVRFYKGANNTGTHVGNLWSSSGTLLATATFTGESATGWQQVTFATPVAILANTTYVASYRAPNGGYAANANYFTTSGVDSGALHAPSSPQVGGNGVYSNGASSAFPTQSFSDSNYWVDVVFSQTMPTVITGIGASGITSAAATIRWTTNTAASSQVFYGTTTAYGSQTTLDTTAVTSHAQTLSGLQPSTTYHYQVQSKDSTGVLVSSPDQIFTTAPTSCPCSLWTAGTTPATASAADANPYELGVRFKSDTSGHITGIRFYKGPNNNGTHVGNLWSSTGTLLATATFTGESATGWQQVTFATPVAIAANTTYVASYRAPNGGYAVNANYFSTSGVDSGTLHAPSSPQVGGNGVYSNGASSVFPNQNFNDSNYWIDVVFTP